MACSTSLFIPKWGSLSQVKNVTASWKLSLHIKKRKCFSFIDFKLCRSFVFIIIMRRYSAVLQKVKRMMFFLKKILVLSSDTTTLQQSLYPIYPATLQHYVKLTIPLLKSMSVFSLVTLRMFP